MKPKSSLRAFLLYGGALFTMPFAQATNLYWDIDGLLTGAGGVTPSGTWATGGSTWSTSSAGTAATSASTTQSTDDLFFSAGTNALGAYTVTINTTQNAKSLTFEDGFAALSGTGSITLGAGNSINTVATGINTTIGNNTALTLGGTNGLTKTGAGTLTLNGTTTELFTGGITINGGTLLVDYANRGTNNQYIPASNSLTLGGGTFTVKGNGTNDATQTVAGLTLNAGGGVIANNPNGASRTVTINLGAITSNVAGGSLQFTRGTGVGNITTSNINDATGILSARIVNGATPDWAINTTPGGTNIIGSYASGSYGSMVAGATSDSLNIKLTASLTLTGAHTHNTLKIESPALAQSLALGGNTLTLSSGGLLSTGANPFTISGGNITAGNGISNSNGSYDLIVQQYNTGSTGLTISADIVNNGGNAVNLVKAGNNVLTLSGNKSYTGNTYVNGGILDFAATTPAGSGRSIYIAAGAGVKSTLGTINASNFLNRIAQTSNEFTILPGGSSNVDLSGGDFPNAFLGNWASNGAKFEYTGTYTAASDYYRLGSPNLNSGVFGVRNASAMGGTQGLIIGGGSVLLVGAKTFSGETFIRNGARLGLASATGALGGNGTALGLQNSALNTGDSSSTGNFWLESGGATGPVADSAATTSVVFGGLIGSRNLASVYSTTTGANNTAATATASITGFTLNPGSGKSYTYSGVIANFATGTTITKTGAGTQVFAGANTYSGMTTVSGGKLTIASTGTINNTSGVSIGAGEFNYNSVTALSQAVSFSGTGGKLSGSGTITPAVTVTSGNTLAPGNSIGTLSFGSGLTLAGTYSVELGTPDASPASGLSDRSVVTGALSVGGNLTLVDNAGANGQGSAGAGAYRIATSTGATTGTFATVTNPLSATLHEKVVYGSNSVDLNLYRLATGSTGAVSLGKARVGDSFTGSATVMNSATADGFSENLNASVGSNAGDVNSSSGTVSSVIAGASSSTINVGLSTTASGAKSGSVLVSYVSDGTGTSGYGTTANGSQTVGVSGTVYDYADAAFSQTAGDGTLTGGGLSYTLDFGTGLALNTLYTATIQLANTFFSGFQDNLGGSYSNIVSGEFTSGVEGTTIASLVVGGSNIFTISFYTGSSGIFGDTLTFSGLSQQSGLGDASLGNFSIALSGVTAVPESNVAALIGGLGMFALLRRRRTA